MLLALALVAPAAAPAYPPITCGRTTVKGHVMIVRTHGPSCSFAVRWVRAFVAHHAHPRGYRCRAYGAALPADCIASKRRYFQGGAAP